VTERSIYRSPEGRQKIRDFYDSVLARWSVSHRPLTIETPHGSTFVLDCGPREAPPVVLLHGANSNALAWAGEAAELASRFRVCAVDVPGEPGRSSERRLPLDGPSHAQWLSELLDGLGMSGAAVVGVSQGGWIALRFATAYPDRVNRLVLLAPGGVAPARTGFLLRAIPLSLLGRHGARAVVRLTLGGHVIDETATRFLKLVMANVRPRIEPQPQCTDEELRRLTMPVLLIQGTDDPIIDTGRTAERLRAQLPRLEERMIPGQGHVLLGYGPTIASFLTGGASFDSEPPQAVA
jgi:pimeloyl-ACP methyl ester carboxylesterase